MSLRLTFSLTFLSFAAGALPVTQSRCDKLLAAFGSQLADATCFESTDLTTNNPNTTPQNNSIPTLPPFAFTPQTDRAVIAPDAAHKTPITKVVPGIQLNARIASDAQGQARFLLRLPDSWNGRLVVAGASGTRSEFNGDFAWSDYVLQEGYAYASQNKGVLNLKLSTAADPLACRLNPTSPVFVHFFDNDPGQQFTRWAEFMAEGAQLAQRGARSHYGRGPQHTYAVGTSNGGYQVRRAVESYPDLFDGGVDWEGTFVDEHAPNLLTDLPAAVLNFPDYAASLFNQTSTAAANIRAAGYPPDIVSAASSLWSSYSAQFWEVTQCQWQKRLDPTYDTYGSGPGFYNYVARLSVSDVGAQVKAFATTGRIQRPLITVAGTMDGLLPIDHHARAYARKVAAHQGKDEDDRGRDDRDQVAYRLYEVQNGNHIETFKTTFDQLEFIEPHAQRAFDLLVDSVEHHNALPASQCIPRGGSIQSAPAQPGHCANLFAP
jgi:3HB-oligomer hydrolase (3HBOH)/Tannase and feruloyl esterase